MILKHHNYRLLDENNVVLSTADKLVDARSVAAYLFRRAPALGHINVLAWLYDKKAERGGYSHVTYIERPVAAELPQAA